MVYSSLEELIENFSYFDNWEDRYKYLIDLGKKLPAMENDLKNDQNLVKGCTSQVWLVSQEKEGGKFHFIIDSDAHIVKGLIAILLGAYQDKTKEEIAAIDIEAAFEQMGLNQHLSPNRRSGFFAMVERVRGIS